MKSMSTSSESMFDVETPWHKTTRRKTEDLWSKEAEKKGEGTRRYSDANRTEITAGAMPLLVGKSFLSGLSKRLLGL